MEAVFSFLTSFALNNPKLASVCAIAYLVGLGAKGLRDAAEKFVLESPSKKDDAKLEEVKLSKGYKILAYALDFLLRLKKPNA